MNKTITLILATALSCLFGCSPNYEKQIIGKWKSASFLGDRSITEYQEDGTFSIKAFTGEHEYENNGKWEILDDGKMKMEYVEGTNITTVIFAYSIHGDTMTRHFDFTRID